MVVFFFEFGFDELCLFLDDEGSELDENFCVWFISGLGVGDVDFVVVGGSIGCGCCIVVCCVVIRVVGCSVFWGFVDGCNVFFRVVGLLLYCFLGVKWGDWFFEEFFVFGM